MCCIIKNSTNTSNNKSIYWLATRTINLFSNHCDFGVYCVKDGNVAAFPIV